jgi:nucleotide-binding universal stress UspA family protein
MGEQILVPFDGSDPSREALNYALDSFSDPDIIVLYVISIPEGYWSAFETDPTDLPIYESAKEEGADILDEAVEIATDAGVDIDTQVATGAPADRIVERSEDEDADLIVIGSHGREGVSHVLLGSVAEKVVRRASRPVLVAK